MKTKYIAVVAMLACLSLAQSSSAADGAWGVPTGDTMKAQAGVGTTYQGVHVCFEFTFRLREDSDGIYPEAEVVEIEVPGELNADGSEGSAFMISAPFGSFSKAVPGLHPNNEDSLGVAFNPRGLGVCQHFMCDVFDFVTTDGPYVYPHPSAPGVTHFCGLIIQRDEGEGITMSIRTILTHSRPQSLRHAPSLLELLHGSPILRIGNDEWRSYLYTPYSPFWPYLPIDETQNWSCRNFFQATYYD